MALKDEYLNLVTSEHRDKEKYMLTLETLLNYVDSVFNVGVKVDDEFDIDFAVGVQQDVIGEIIDQKRPVGFDDDMYRVLEKLKVFKNMWNGEIDGFYEVWYGLFDIPIIVEDPQDMTISLCVDVDPADETTALLKIIGATDLMPKPMGVRMKYKLIYGRDHEFNIKLGFIESYVGRIRFLAEKETE